MHRSGRPSRPARAVGGARPATALAVSRAAVRLAVALAAATILALAPAAAPAAAAGARPATVPALRSWTPAKGHFALRDDARVVVRGRDRTRLLGEARTLAADLSALLRRHVAAGAAPARAGDVALGSTRGRHGLGTEGYRLRVGRTFAIGAPTAAGAYYGGRTLLQLVRGGAPIPGGEGRDFPRYAERGLMIDDGRVFYSRRWLEARIAELGALKLNMLHLHLSDSEGFRIESRSHPEAVTRPALSRADVRALVASARRNHVTIVPEVDAPGHMTAALRSHPELQLTDSAGRRQPDKLDVTKPAARRFYLDLLDELSPLFPGRWWHMGADEYLGAFSTDADFDRYPQLAAWARARYGPRANGKDAVLAFVNEIGSHIRARGKGLRVWSDGAGGGSAVRLDRRASVEWWEERRSPTPRALVDAGHRVLNTGWWPSYYLTGGPLASLRTPVAQAYEDWRPWQFTGPWTPDWNAKPPALRRPAATLAPGDPRQLGGSLAVWNDDPAAPGASERTVAAGIAPRLRVLSQRLWGSPDLTRSYAAFARLTRRAAGTGG